MTTAADVIKASTANTSCTGDATPTFHVDADVGDRAMGSATSPNGVESSTSAPITTSASDSGDSTASLDPTTPTPSHHIPQPNSPTPHLDHARHPLSTQSVTSLTSSRPAPPSPAMSRRASGLSRSSSNARSRPASGVSGTSSRPVSGAPGSLPPFSIPPRPLSGPAPGGTLSRASSGRRPKDVLGMSSVAESKEQNEDLPDLHTVPDDDDDYAYQDSRLRIRRFGSSVLAKRLRLHKSSSSASSSSSEGEGESQWEDEPEGGANGWGAFKWGFGRGWGFGVRGSVSNTAAGIPSRGDLDRNFGEPDEGGEDEDEDEGEMYDDGEGEMYDDGEELSDELYEDEDANPEGELLLPGLYRALYSFEPEGTAEMRLEEDQMVRVIGRGGGVGWAVVAKDGLKDTGVHALVPESYLERCDWTGTRKLHKEEVWSDLDTDRKILGPSRELEVGKKCSLSYSTVTKTLMIKTSLFEPSLFYFGKGHNLTSSICASIIQATRCHELELAY
ncbi:hypothetical protein BU15DRAFT_63491 [Melanogaster broomeanus]|nr:hypothetical protein BU15DRAFT_63491 [Melanogaster broomeanus]